MEFTIRPRMAGDVPALAELLERQQPASRYPFVWPFPGGVESFLVRDGELASWVAESPSGALVGHVALARAEENTEGRLWAEALNVGVDELRCVSVLFTDPDLAGAGVGSALLAHATRAAARDGWPVLDVVASAERPVQLYQRRGWRIIATIQAPWHPELDLPVHLMVLPREGDA